MYVDPKSKAGSLPLYHAIENVKMTKIGKRLLILVLLLIFAAGGGYAVLYAQGLRFDFAKFAFKRVGALYVRSFPQDAAIRLDGAVLPNDSGIFQSGTFVNSLFP